MVFIGDLGTSVKINLSFYMLCLVMMISFENIDLTQILCLANKKNLNLDLSQIHHYYKKWLKISN